MTDAKTAWTWITDRHIPSCSAEGHELILEIVEKLQNHGWSTQQIFGVHLSLTEGIVNAIRHGNGSDLAKQVHVVCKVSTERCWIQIEDEGPGFDPDDVPDCTLDENLKSPAAGASS